MASPTGIHSPALRSQPEMPSYFRKDRVGRDEFLSQLGHFTEEQRGIFNRLCDMWEPDIAYGKFFAKAGHEFLNPDAALHSLMTHLEKGNCGLIALLARDATLEKNLIILTDRDAPRFWYWLVENRWQACLAADRTEFPTLSGVTRRSGFPNEFLQPLALAEISGSFVQEHADDLAIYALPDLDGRTLVVTPASIYTMVEVARLKVRATLADSPLLPVLARMLATVVSDLGKSLEKNEGQFWNRLTEAITANREDLVVKKANVDPEFFIAAKILKVFTHNELDEAEHRREEDIEKRETIQAILAQLSRTVDFLMTERDFLAQFAPYRDRWPDLQEMFASHYMTPTSKTGLPAVVKIGDDYLFRDHIFPLFKSRHADASHELHGFYLGMIDRILRTNNRDKLTAFGSLSAFRDDVRERLRTEFPVLSDLLSKPRLVSEAIIHHTTKVSRITDMERVKIVLNRYFEGGAIRFKNPELLFDLPPRQLFEEAFTHLGWFRRLMLRLFGRWESYMQSLAVQSAGADDPAASRSARLTSQQSAEESFPSESARPYRPSGYPAESVTAQAVRRRKQSHGLKRAYSAKQQEDAWEEFRHVYEKKKGKP